MIRRQSEPDEPEPYHRQWLHAMEAESTIPGTVMQVARIYADHAASRGGRWASVSYPALIRQTHRSRDTLVEAHEWMTDYGWLRLRPGKDGEQWRDGQRKSYDLTIGQGGEKRKPVRQPERSEARKQSGSRNGPTSKHSGQQNGSPETDHSGQQNATVPVDRTEPFRSPERERLTSRTSLSPGRGSLQAKLATVVPDVTERETELILEKIAADPGVRSATAVLRAEIRDGNGPALVEQIRRAASTAAPDRPPWCRRCDERTRMLLDENGQQGNEPCPLCRPGHPAPDQTAAVPAIPDDLVGPVPLITAVAGLPDHPNSDQVMPNHPNLIPVIGTDQANEVPVIRGDHPNVVRATFALADVEVSASDIADRNAIGRDALRPECQYDRCPVPSSPIEAGRNYHTTCEYLAAVKAGPNQREAPAAPALVGAKARSPYPDDSRDEMPDDYGGR